MRADHRLDAELSPHPFASGLSETVFQRGIGQDAVGELREADRLYMVHGGWVIPVNELDGKAYAVDMAEIAAINDAIHTGRTHDDALGIGPVGDYDV